MSKVAVFPRDFFSNTYNLYFRYIYTDFLPYFFNNTYNLYFRYIYTDSIPNLLIPGTDAVFYNGHNYTFEHEAYADSMQVIASRLHNLCISLISINDRYVHRCTYLYFTLICVRILIWSTFVVYNY